MIPPPFRYRRPATVDEAIQMLAEPGSTVLAGGQTLINALKLDLVHPEALVDVSRLADLKGIERTDGGLRVGAGVTYAEIARSPEASAADPVLVQVCSRLVDRQVRNRGTIGGNVCLNDPTSNLPPLLAALDATFEVRDADGPRTLHAADFFRGTLQTAATGGALLTHIDVPAQADDRVAYRSQLVGADSWALARAVVRVRRDGRRITDARVVLATVSDSPLRVPVLEAALTSGADAYGEALAAFDALDLDVPADTHASADYRRSLLRAQLRRALGDVLAPSEGAAA